MSTETKTYDWHDLVIGQEVVIDDIEYLIVLKAIMKPYAKDGSPIKNRRVLYLKSLYAEVKVMGEMDEDGSLKLMRNKNQEDFHMGEELTPEMMTYQIWDDKQLEKAIEEMNKPFSMLEETIIWNDIMKCGHRVKDYEPFIDAEDNIVRVRFICVEGCVTEWFEVGKIPLPHNHEMAEIQVI